MFFDDLIEQLNNVASKSNSVPAQMCGEAAEVIKKLLEHESLLSENEFLRQRIGQLEADLLKAVARASNPLYLYAGSINTLSSFGPGSPYDSSPTVQFCDSPSTKPGPIFPSGIGPTWKQNPDGSITLLLGV